VGSANLVAFSSNSAEFRNYFLLLSSHSPKKPIFSQYRILEALPSLVLPFNMSSLSPVFDLLSQSAPTPPQLQQALSLLSPYPPFNSLSPALQLSLVPFVRPQEYTEGQTIACDWEHWMVALVAKGHVAVLPGNLHVLDKQKSMRRRSKSHTSISGNKPGNEAIVGPGEDLLPLLSPIKTAYCMDSVGILVLLKRDFTSILTHRENKSSLEKTNFLLSVPAFSMWTQASLFRYLDLFQPRTYVKGDVVYREGSQAVEVYIVREGEFKFVKRLEQGVRRKRAISLQNSPIRLRKPEVQLLLKSSREVLGDMEVLDDLPRAHTCVCVSPTAQVYVISKSVHAI